MLQRNAKEETLSPLKATRSPRKTAAALALGCLLLLSSVVPSPAITWAQVAPPSTCDRQHPNRLHSTEVHSNAGISGGPDGGAFSDLASYAFIPCQSQNGQAYPERQGCATQAAGASQSSREHHQRLATAA